MSSQEYILNDRQIRMALKSKVLSRYLKEPDTIMIDELGIQHGGTRIDVALINGQMHGFEIKSDYDTLARLPAQVKAYSSVFDRVTLVVGSRHFEQAVQLIPDWWGVKCVVFGSRGSIRFNTTRTPLKNFEINSLALASLLWREEALTFLEELGAARGLYSKSKSIIYARLAEVAQLDLLRARVRQQLKARPGWRSGKMSM